MIANKVTEGNSGVEKEYGNLKNAYNRNSKYLPEVYEIDDGFYRWLFGHVTMYSSQWLFEYREVNISENEANRLCLNLFNPEHEESIDFSLEDSHRIREEMVKILTVYYDLERGEAIGYLDPDGNKRCEALLQHGDFTWAKKPEEVLI